MKTIVAYRGYILVSAPVGEFIEIYPSGEPDLLHTSPDMDDARRVVDEWHNAA